MTSSEQIARWLTEPEGERIKFKTASNNFHFEKLVDYCVARANEGGGKIILGVTDRPELRVDGKLNIAALILFGTRAALGRHLAQAEIVFEYRSSEASGPAQDRIEFREGFFLYHETLWERINLRNDRQSYQDGLFRYDIPTFDETAVGEALSITVAHRDYLLGASICVQQ